MTTRRPPNGMNDRLLLVSHDAVRHDGQGRIVRELALGALATGWQVTLHASAVDADLVAAPGLTWRRVAVPRRPIALKKLLFLLLATRHDGDRAIAPPPPASVGGAYRGASLADRAPTEQSGTAAGAGQEASLTHIHGAVRLGHFDLATCHICHSARDLGTAQGRAWPAYYRASNACQAWLERQLYRRGLIVAVSAKVANELISTAGVAPERLRVIRPGVDPAAFRPPTPEERYAARASLHLRDGEIAALFVGDATTEQKGLRTLLDALAVADLACVRLFIAGRYTGGPFPAEVQRRGLAERVRFLGPRVDVPALLHAADLFVLPSRYEAFSLATLEAMASGLPVVVSDARFCGAAELIRDGESGLLVAPDQPAALVSALRALVADERLRARLGQAARAAAARQTWQAMVARYLALYDGLRQGAIPSQAELDALV